MSELQQLYGINDLQMQTLQEFKSLLEDEGLYIPINSNKSASHDDPTLLRFLRARRWDINAAAIQFEKTEAWRRSNQVDNLYNEFDVAEFEEARDYYPQWTGRRDKKGVPIYCYAVSTLNNKAMTTFYKSDSKTQANSALPGRLQKLFVSAEHGMQFVIPLCSTIKGKPLVTSTSIVDISGVGLRDFWNLKKHLQDASEMTTNYYPECLENVFVIGAPSFFPRIWSFAKGWFDAATTKKIFILSAGEVTETLSRYIDMKDIPRKYGGQLDWDFGKAPALDDDAMFMLEKSSVNGQYWPAGPVKWVEEGREGTVHLEGRIQGAKRSHA